MRKCHLLVLGLRGGGGGLLPPQQTPKMLCLHSMARSSYRHLCQDGKRDDKSNPSQTKDSKTTKDESKCSSESPGGGNEGHEQQREKEDEREDRANAIREQILESAMCHVNTLGWTRECLIQGAADAGYPNEAHGMFPAGGFDLVSYFNGKCNRLLLEEMKATTENGEREIENPLEFLVCCVRKRLEMIVPYKSQWPQAIGLLALPANAPTSLAQLLTLVDDICYYSGDRSVDINWYTRRVGLATIYKMTELYLLQDKSDQHENTWLFLKNRMDEAIQLQSMLGETGNVTNKFQRSFNSAFITARNILGIGYNR